MSEEYDNQNETVTFSPFIPILIVLIGLIGWTGYQVFMANSQRSTSAATVQQAMPTIQQAQNIKDQYIGLMKDLIDTAQKDPQAAQIVKEAQAAGLLRVQQPAATNGAAASAPAPAPAAGQ